MMKSKGRITTAFLYRVWILNREHSFTLKAPLAPRLCPKWHPVPYIAHNFPPGSYTVGTGSRKWVLVHYIETRVPFGIQPGDNSSVTRSVPSWWPPQARSIHTEMTRCCRPAIKDVLLKCRSNSACPVRSYMPLPASWPFLWWEGGSGTGSSLCPKGTRPPRVPSFTSPRSMPLKRWV